MVGFMWVIMVERARSSHRPEPDPATALGPDRLGTDPHDPGAGT